MTGKVYLVGAGPGAPDLLTLRAARLLISKGITHEPVAGGSVGVGGLASRAQKVAVGKRCGRHSTAQQFINKRLVDAAKRHQVVVRLKGGDPMMFGRAQEEIAALEEAGIACEVVPGITAALACAAYAGIPLTHREHAQSVRFVTAHAKAGGDEPEWPALAAPNQTLAFYMGVAAAGRVAERLVAHGRAASTPVAIVENGSQPSQRVVVGTLATLPALVVEHAIRSPALVIVGEVAALATRLHWFGDAPLGDTALPMRNAA